MEKIQTSPASHSPRAKIDRASRYALVQSDHRHHIAGLCELAGNGNKCYLSSAVVFVKSGQERKKNSHVL